jgi:hypothetical protein
MALGRNIDKRPKVCFNTFIDNNKQIGETQMGKQIEIAEAVVIVEEMARGDYYEKGGDRWVEALPTKEKEALVHQNKCTTEKKTRDWAKKFFKGEARKNMALAEIQGLYDTGEEKDKKEYDRIVAQVADEVGLTPSEVENVADTYEDDGVNTTKSVIDPTIKKSYGKSQSCGDDVSKKMANAMTKGDSLEQIAQRHEIDLDRWSHLNRGMQRMNLGNCIRGQINRGEIVDFIV